MTKSKILLYALFLCSLILGCNSQDVVLVEYSGVIPKPDSVELGKEQFLLSATTSLDYDKNFKTSAEFLSSYLYQGLKANLNTNVSAQKNTINFQLDTSFKNPEAYKLIITKNEITIKAATDQGAFYAVQTLRQLLPTCFENGSCSSKDFALPEITITDQPEFRYRGMHLDVGRHFFKVEDIKKYIDVLSLLKLNTFHWHLTEDQGWRIEIKKYPKLTEIGGYRKETLIGHYNDQPHKFDGERYGGFYSQEEIKEVVAYAKSRNVSIIPEIEMPGHSRAALAAYPELSCTLKPVEVGTKWGIYEDAFCPKEETFEFLENVLDEVMDLFPGEYIHIGGDEVPKVNWKNCKHCQQLIREKGLKNEEELQSYFIKRIEDYVNSKGRKIIGWDEIIEGGLAPNATVMSWRGTEGAVQSANQGNDVIMSPLSHCYFDYYQSNNDEEPLAIGGFLPLKKVYEFNPIPIGVEVRKQKHILGAQGNIWTEYMKDFDKVSYMAFPRAMALSEALWSRDSNKNYTDFVKRWEHFRSRLELLDIKYANHIYDINGNLTIDKESIKYTLTTLLSDKDVRYTTNGSYPDSSSKRYERPIELKESTVIKAAVFDQNKRVGNSFEEHFDLHKAVGSTIQLNIPPHPSYNAGGKEALVNGIQGSDKRYGDKEWLGFWGEDVSITMDLKAKKSIHSITTRFFNANGQWIYAPRSVKVSFSDDNETFSDSIQQEVLVEDIAQLTTPLIINLDGVDARFLKIEVKNYGYIPEGAQGAGNKAWTFIDEIIIK